EKIEAAKPIAIADDFGPGNINDLADLLQIILSIGFDLFNRETRARLIAAAGIAHQGRIVAEDEHGMVAQFLEQAQLAKRHRMAEMDIDPRRIDTVLDAE